MTAPEGKSLLANFNVAKAMRRLVVSLPSGEDLAKAAARIIKYKVGALLVTGGEGEALGVISKSDLMTAYYGQMPLETPVEDMMFSPPATCGPEDTLETALELMRSLGVHRLYVRVPDGPVKGLLAYPDLVGIIYRACRHCPRSRYGRAAQREGDNPAAAGRLRVKDVMTGKVRRAGRDDSLYAVMEIMSVNRVAAVLLTGAGGLPVGVVSKTDLVLAFRHGLSPETRAGEIMSSPVLACHAGHPLVEALHYMMLADVDRLFVHRDDSDDIRGVLSLSGVAKFRSGSCRACTSARLGVG